MSKSHAIDAPMEFPARVMPSIYYVKVGFLMYIFDVNTTENRSKHISPTYWRTSVCFSGRKSLRVELCLTQIINMCVQAHTSDGSKNPTFK